MTQKPPRNRPWRASLARLSRDHARVAPPPCRLPKPPMVVWAIGCWPYPASRSRIAQTAQQQWPRQSGAPADWIGAAKSAKLAKWPHACACACDRARVPVACARVRVRAAVRACGCACVRLCARAAACACGCVRVCPRAGAGGRGRGGAGAGARVTVTGTTRKQFFIFYILATQFIAALPAHPASSIMAP